MLRRLGRALSLGGKKTTQGRAKGTSPAAAPPSPLVTPELRKAAEKAASMYRPLIIVGAFLLVTGSLIFFQPKPPGPALEIAEVSEVKALVDDKNEADDVAEVIPFQTEQPFVATPQPEATEPATAIEVTRSTPITLSTQPAAGIGPSSVDRDEMLFGRLAEERPNLLTATRRAPDGTLRPSLLQLGNAGSAPAPSAAPVETTVAAVTPLAPTVAPPTPAPTLETFASASVPNDLRTAIAAAQTQAVHTVRLGDSLTTLSLRYYNDGTKGDLIYEANRRVLTSKILTVGQLLRIPDLSDL